MLSRYTVRGKFLRMLPPASLAPGDEVVFATTPPPSGTVWVVDAPPDGWDERGWHRNVWVRAKTGVRRKVSMGRLRLLRSVETRVAERLMT